MDQLILKASSCQKPLDMQQVVLWIRWISTEYLHIKLRYFDICYSELNGEKGRAWISSPLCLAYVSVCLLSMQVLWKKRWSRQNALARVRTAGIKMMLQHCQTISQQTKHIVINCTFLSHQPEWSHSNQGTIPFSHKLQGLVHRMVVGWPVYPSKSILSVVNKCLLTVDSFVQCLWQHSHLSGQDPYDPQYGPRSCCEGTRRCGPWYQDMMQHVDYVGPRVGMKGWNCALDISKSKTILPSMYHWTLMCIA